MKKIVEKARKISKSLLKHILKYKIFYLLPDVLYLKIKFRLSMCKRLNLKNPVSFNEKIQWLKLYNRNPLYTLLSDKYEVREHISKLIGEEYLVPLIGVWKKFEEIDLDALPYQFALKCTHESGGVLICKDKSKLDFEAVRKKFHCLLKKNYYYSHREWAYKHIKPRILCEKLILTKDGQSPIDYKFHCFNGNPDNVMVCTERESGKAKFYYFNREWELLKYNKRGIDPPDGFSLPKPGRLNEMFRIAEILSRGFPYVRVDLYHEDDRIYFGELTFYPDAGFDFGMMKETDLLFGRKIDLPPKNQG